MIKLLAIADLSVRGVCVPRLYPLERLTENGYPVTVKVRHKYPTTYDLQWCDVVYFLRAINLTDLNFVKKAKALRKLVWVDTDDDMFSIPIDHACYFEYRDSDFRDAYIEIHKLADVVSYSTRTLATSHSSLNANSLVIPCAYPDERISGFKDSHAGQGKIVYWRGTATHEKSLMEFAPSIISLAKKYPDWEFHFSGCKPWFILEKIKNPWRVYGWFDVDDLLEHIHGLRPCVNMVARTSNAFTRARSSISYIETTFGGAVTVAPNWEEWRKPGILNYRSKKEFVTQMSEAMNSLNGQSNRDRVSLAFKYIEDNCTWTRTNAMHCEALASLGLPIQANELRTN